jgi:hypothetical protein
MRVKNTDGFSRDRSSALGNALELSLTEHSSLTLEGGWKISGMGRMR